MPNPDLIADLLAGVLALLGVATYHFERWAYRAGAAASRKFLGYAEVTLLLWTLTATAVWTYGWERLLESPVASGSWLPAPAITGPLSAVVLAGFFLLTLLPLVQSLRGRRWRRAYQAAIRRVFAETGVPGMIPNDPAERAAWIGVSLTAGVCEEVLFRGFLIRFLHGGALDLPLAGALAGSCLCFGLAHVYLGLKGVLRTAITGFGFGLLYLLSGSLVPCIVLHALMDLQMVYVMRPISEETAGIPEAV